jgi:hypothetical protein
MLQAATEPYGGSRSEKRRRQRGGKPRIDSVTDTSTVKNTDVLRLGFIPNWRKKRKKEKQETRKELADLAHMKVKLNGAD